MHIHGEEILMILIVGEFLAGLIANGFVALVSCINWVKSKTPSTVDLILIALATSRISLLFIIKWNSFLLIFFLGEPTEYYEKLMDYLWIITHQSSVWFATSLSIFYFLKIATFSNSFFFWLKWRITQVVYIVMTGPLLISLSFGFLWLENIYSNKNLSSRENGTGGSQEVQVSRSSIFVGHISLNFLSFPPFMLCSISCYLVVLSLWKHTKKMQLKTRDSRDPSTEAHIRAMRAMFSFLILLILYYVGISITQDYSSFSKISSMFGMVIMSLYPSGHTLILILWNSKLRFAFLHIWRQVKCCVK